MIFHNVTSNVSFTRKSLWIKKTLPFAPVVTSVTKRSFPPWGKKPLWSIWKQHLISLCWWHVLLSGWKRCCSPYWPCSPCWQGSHNLIGFTSLLTKCIYLYFYICLHACMSELTTVSNHSVRVDQHPLNDAPSAVEMFLFVFNKNVFICALLMQKNLWCKKRCDAKKNFWCKKTCDAKKNVMHCRSVFYSVSCSRFAIWTPPMKTLFLQILEVFIQRCEKVLLLFKAKWQSLR